MSSKRPGAHHHNALDDFSKADINQTFDTLIDYTQKYNNIHDINPYDMDKTDLERAADRAADTLGDLRTKRPIGYEPGDTIKDNFNEAALDKTLEGNGANVGDAVQMGVESVMKKTPPGAIAVGVNDALYKVADKTDLLSPADIAPDPVDQIAAYQFNDQLKNVDGNSFVEQGGRAFRVEPEIFKGPHNDFYNTALNLTSRMDPSDREGAFETLHEMAETQAADKAAYAPKAVHDMRAIEMGTYGDLNGVEKLDKLEELAEQAGYFNPRGEGQLHYNDNGIIIRDPAVTAAESAEFRAYKDASPLERTDAVDGYKTISTHEVVTQFKHDVRDTLNDPLTAPGLRSVLENPRGPESVYETLEECRLKGETEIRVNDFNLDTPQGRVVGVMKGVNDLGMSKQCDAWAELRQSVADADQEYNPEKYQNNTYENSYENTQPEEVYEADPF